MLSISNSLSARLILVCYQKNTDFELAVQVTSAERETRAQSVSPKNGACVARGISSLNIFICRFNSTAYLTIKNCELSD